MRDTRDNRTVETLSRCLPDEYGECDRDAAGELDASRELPNCILRAKDRPYQPTELESVELIRALRALGHRL